MQWTNLAANVGRKRYNLKAKAARIGKKKKSINLLKPHLADIKFNATKKTEAAEKDDDKLWSEL